MHCLKKNIKGYMIARHSLNVFTSHMCLVLNPLMTWLAGIIILANCSYVSSVGRALGNWVVPLCASRFILLLGFMSMQLRAEALLSMFVGTSS